jgi:hypothetical protein
MPYCTPDDLKPLVAVGDVTAVAWGVGPYPAQAAVEDLIARKSATIDGICASGGYTVPFAPVPGLIADLCIMRCLVELLPKIHRDVPEQIQAARGYAVDADKLQNLIVNNLVSLVSVETPGAVATGNAVTRTLRQTKPPFSMTDLD